MKARTRFIKSVIKTARDTETTAMPWTRGVARSQSVLRRQAAPEQGARKTA
ncbi:hypothetical protein QEZ52_08365 [Aliisedimentitalea scapharcae]|uniref:Uncharacterized protein n=1 Tax=Aliisedimentitalea scapharcae TaxID=1524259 RepID=A0ABZ2Y0V5_9RHOB|nr:hypothetical protein K3727_08145 [Rhodobacteraceae bacterium M382]